MLEVALVTGEVHRRCQCNLKMNGAASELLVGSAKVGPPEHRVVSLPLAFADIGRIALSPRNLRVAVLA